MFILNHKKFFLFLAIVLVVASIGSIFHYGLKPSIDFKGGSVLEVAWNNGPMPEVGALKSYVSEHGYPELTVQTSGSNEYLLKVRSLDEKGYEDIVAVVNAATNGGDAKSTNVVEVKQFSSIGPSIGKELTRKAWLAILIVVIAIILFIAFAFRQVSYPISSWVYGVVAVVTLAHDIIIPTGLFAALGHYQGAEVDTLFVVALLTVLGLSVHDRIVVFDRIRENLKLKKFANFYETVGKSIEQTFVRSVNTSLTIIFVLLSLYFIGPVATKNFSLVLTVGLFFGIYSSVFVASPLLTVVEKWQNRRAK